MAYGDDRAIVSVIAVPSEVVAERGLAVAGYPVTGHVEKPISEGEIGRVVPPMVAQSVQRQ
eukprot:COSAG05_NODE_1116_length_5825_cov_11.050304_7_plen_61_part_00